MLTPYVMYQQVGKHCAMKSSYRHVIIIEILCTIFPDKILFQSKEDSHRETFFFDTDYELV